MHRTFRAFARVALVALSVGCDTPKTHQPGVDPVPPEPEPAPPPAAAAEVELPLHLVGSVEIPGSTSLRWFARIEQGENGPAGTISIPAQGANNLDLANIEVSSDAVRFELAPAGAKWTGAIEGDRFACSFEQHAVKLDCTMEKVSAELYAAAGHGKRPQDPEPPFPYDIEEVAYANGEVNLAGTLTLPKGGPHAAALLISGSGAQNRDEEILGHKPFWVLADHLSRKGIAVLRVDDRGVGGSTGASADITMMDFAADVRAGLAFLRAHDRVAPDNVGLVGHSEGGAVAFHVAAGDPKVAFVVSLAGPGVDGGEILVEQGAALTKAMGGSEAQVADVRKKQAEAMALVRKTKDPGALRAELLKILEGDDAEARLAIVTSPWFRTFVTYDPAKDLRKLRMPVLALNGSLDTQVVADQNVPALEKALARNRKAKVQRLEGLNHLFQHAQTGSPTEYGTIEETIDPAVLELVATFVADSV
jgi:hypothetical protein